jgi:tyrosine-specific transport protein
MTALFVEPLDLHSCNAVPLRYRNDITQRKGAKMSNTTKNQSVIGATLLVTGCCIGAGMLGLPVKTALAGFLPSTVAMVLCYAFTTITGLFIVEATLWFDKKVNLPTIVESILGKKGKLITSLLFLTLFYSLFVAYLDGGGIIFADIISSLTGIEVPKAVGITLCTLLMAGITYAGTHLANRLNQILLFGLAGTYFLLITLGLQHAGSEHPPALNLLSTLNVVPIMLICFGYQNLVPSIAHYLKNNVKQIRIAIIIGNFIPLLVYVLWNYVILNIMPADQAIIKNADIITQLFQGTVSMIFIVALIKSFSLFAMLTSFIPNAISLVDFVKDGLRKEKHDLFYLGLVFVPSYIFTLIYPHLFINMLDFAGGFIDVLLFGVLPAVIILMGRKRMAISGQHYQVMGGVVTPVIIIIISLAVLCIKLAGFYA